MSKDIASKDPTRNQLVAHKERDDQHDESATPPMPPTPWVVPRRPVTPRKPRAFVAPTGELRAWLLEINRPPNGYREAGLIAGVGEATMQRLVQRTGSKRETIAKVTAAMQRAKASQR